MNLKCRWTMPFSQRYRQRATKTKGLNVDKEARNRQRFWLPRINRGGTRKSDQAQTKGEAPKNENAANPKKQEIKQEVDQMVPKGSVINTDGSNSFNKLEEDYQHKPEAVEPKQASKLLPWAHKAISNAKKAIIGCAPQGGRRFPTELS